MKQPVFIWVWRKGWITCGLLILSFVYALHVSWLKWGDLIVDSGREMYVPLRLAEGAVLYRDIFYLYGPFSPYLHAVLFRLFGVHLDVLIWSGICSAALTVFLVYKITRLISDVLTASLTAWVCLSVCIFGHYLFLANYNFVIPYSYPATHAMLMSLGGLYFFLRFILLRKHFDVWLTACMVFLCLVTRLEMGIMLLSAVAVGGVWLKASFIRREIRLRWIVRPMLAAVALAAGVYGLFGMLAGDTIRSSSLGYFAAANTMMDNPFTAHLSGLDQWPENLVRMMQSSGFYLLSGLCFFVGGLGLRKAFLIEDTDLRWVCAAGIVALTILSEYALVIYGISADAQYRALPVIAGLAVLGAAARVLSRRNSRRPAMLITVGIFAELVLLRIFFNVHPRHYGFSLMMPGLIVYHVLLLRLVPRLALSRVTRCWVRVGFAGLLIIFAFDHIRMSNVAYNHRTQEVRTRRGRMRVFQTPRDLICAQVVRYLAQRTPKDATVVVLPEGLTINFLSGRENPLYYYSYMPPDFFSEGIEEQVVRSIDALKVDYVVLLQRPLEEYQIQVFGRDYARSLWGYLLHHYHEVERMGPFPYQSADFGAAILQRNTSVQNPGRE